MGHDDADAEKPKKVPENEEHFIQCCCFSFFLSKLSQSGPTSYTEVHVSVSRWLECLFNIWPFTTIKCIQ